MVSQIISRTPPWVWAVFLALLFLGSMQVVPRVVSLGRVLRISLLMAAFSSYGTVSSFGADVQVLLCWLSASAAFTWITLRIPLAAGVRYLPEKRAFQLPGSWTPLALMMGIFVVKYLAGVLMSAHVPIVNSAAFGPAVGLVYGAFSGLFIGRVAKLLQLARQAPPGLSQV